MSTFHFSIQLLIDLTRIQNTIGINLRSSVSFQPQIRLNPVIPGEVARVAPKPEQAENVRSENCKRVLENMH
jgi:hypothetical protein